MFHIDFCTVGSISSSDRKPRSTRIQSFFIGSKPWGSSLYTAATRWGSCDDLNLMLFDDEARVDDGWSCSLMLSNDWAENRRYWFCGFYAYPNREPTDNGWQRKLLVILVYQLQSCPFFFFPAGDEEAIWLTCSAGMVEKPPTRWATDWLERQEDVWWLGPGGPKSTAMNTRDFWWPRSWSLVFVHGSYECIPNR